MKSFQEFLIEAKKKRFKDALADYADQQKKKAETDEILARNTKAGSKERRKQVKALIKSQGGGEVRKNQRIKHNLATAANRATRKGKDPSKINAQIAAATTPRPINRALRGQTTIHLVGPLQEP